MNKEIDPSEIDPAEIKKINSVEGFDVDLSNISPALSHAFKKQLAIIMDNIANTDCSATSKREIKIHIMLKPDEDRKKIAVKSKVIAKTVDPEHVSGGEDEIFANVDSKGKTRPGARKTDPNQVDAFNENN